MACREQRSFVDLYIVLLITAELVKRIDESAHMWPNHRYITEAIIY